MVHVSTKDMLVRLLMVDGLFFYEIKVGKGKADKQWL